jgi:general secretion pathway protein J
MRQPPVGSPKAGFTLVEALLATLLMAIILSALAMVTAQWLPNWNRGFARVQSTERLAAGLERLVADLAVAEFVSAGAANDAPFFEGSELSVAFVRTALGPNAGTGLEVVRIAETSDDRGHALVRTTAPFSPGRGGALHFSHPVVLVRAPYRISFSYAGPDRVWRGTWRAQARLPHAIRVQVRDAATSLTLAVSTSTLVHAEIPTRCAVARTVGECQVLANGANAPADARAGGFEGR